MPLDVGSPNDGSGGSAYRAVRRRVRRRDRAPGRGHRRRACARRERRLHVVVLADLGLGVVRRGVARAVVTRAAPMR